MKGVIAETGVVVFRARRTFILCFVAQAIMAFTEELSTCNRTALGRHCRIAFFQRRGWRTIKCTSDPAGSLPKANPEADFGRAKRPSTISRWTGVFHDRKRPKRSSSSDSVDARMAGSTLDLAIRRQFFDASLVAVEWLERSFEE